MTLFFPDVNVWIALSVADHPHRAIAWKWLNGLPPTARLLMGRYTQLAILRITTNPRAMGSQVRTIDEAWTVFESWLVDPRVEFRADPTDLDPVFRAFTSPSAFLNASAWIGDAYLLAFAKCNKAALVTFDKSLYAFARKHHCAAVLPA